ncbi:phosphotransferase [Rathayibacter sp. SD072]|uniref:phosphotransferase n=1 Tax=Rathayibacter sp. SD072 TaxID=2781731 RepID=UPI001A96D0DF|nr:phosphotransferase [Rathayibacter sp. SD072]MBO0984016.1 phosphotransferase [Rathayibacter sp. SD072]
MTGPDLSRQYSLDGVVLPAVVRRLGGPSPELAWRNQADGLTFRVASGYLKWNPAGSGIDLERETVRLRWLQGRHPVPQVLDAGEEDGGQWLLTEAIDGRSAVDPQWIARPETAVRAIARGLRALHDLPVQELPDELRHDSWFHRSLPGATVPALEDQVLVHGDACAPNTLLDDRGEWCGTVDVGDLGLGDRWADLAVAAMSLGWNYGEGFEELLLEEYGATPDEARSAYFRALWSAES